MTAALEGGEWSAARPDRTLPPGKPLYPFYKRLGGSYDRDCRKLNKKIMWSRYRPGVAQRVGRGIAILFHDRGTRRGWVVSSTPWSHFIPGKDPVPIVQEAGWAPGPVWPGGKSRPHRDSIPDRPARSQSLYWLSYPVHNRNWVQPRKSTGLAILLVIKLVSRRNKINQTLIGQRCRVFSGFPLL